MKIRYALALVFSFIVLGQYGVEFVTFLEHILCNWPFVTGFIHLFEGNRIATIFVLIILAIAILPVLSLFTFVGHRIARILPLWTRPSTWLRTVREVEQTSTSQILEPEAPIRTEEEDAFNYGPFAKKVAREMLLERNAPSMVFSIEDHWGSGKTSAINLIESYSAKDPQAPIIIRFNPWQVEPMGQLIEVFLDQLAGALAYESVWFSARRALSKEVLELKALVTSLRDLSEHTSFLSRLLRIGKSRTEPPSFDTKRREIQTQIDRLDRPIIVIIDDIDRLEERGIRTIFQLVKTLCDFRRFAYLLAYDREPIVQALGREKALEKFVQIPYRLPRIGLTELSNWLEIKYRRILKNSGIEWRQLDTDRLREGLLNVAAVLDTPREGLRTLNKATGLLAACQTEVDPTDIILFSGLTTKYPAIEDSIRRNVFKITEGGELSQEGVTTYYAEFAGTDGEERKKADERLLEELIGEVSDPSAKAQVTNVLNSMLASRFDEFRSDTVEPTRIAHINALLTLLNRGTGLYSHEDTLAFLQEDDRREQIFYEYAARGNALEWLQYVATCMQSVQPKKPQSFISRLSKLTQFMWIEHRMGAVDESSLLVRTLTETIAKSNADASFESMDGLARDATCLSLSENVVLTQLSRAGLWRGGKFLATESDRDSSEIVGESMFSKEQILQLTDTWLDTVREKATDSDFSDEPEPISILFRWGQLSANDYTGPREWTRRICADQKFLCTLLGHLKGSGLEGMEKIFWDLGELIDLAEKADIEKQTLEGLKDRAASLDNSKTTTESNIR